MTEAQFPSRQEVLTKLRDANKRLSNSDAEEVHLGDEEGWLPVHSECGEPGRWMYVKTTVYRYKDTDLYYSIDWEHGNTEQQDDGGLASHYWVGPMEVTETVYAPFL
jgi:hypothetical protein